MWRVPVVGGGRSGLQFALSLLTYDYDVTLMTVHNPSEFHEGRTVSFMLLFGDTRGAERKHELDLCDDDVREVPTYRIAASGDIRSSAVRVLGR